VVTGLEDRVYRPDLDSVTGAPCGLGPQLVVDGRAHETRVDGTLREVRDGLPLRATVCDGPLHLAPGDHVLDWRPTDRFEVDTVRVVPHDAASDPVVRRSAGLTVVDPSTKVVDLGPGGEAVLRVAQNFNPGWVADLAGQRLDPIRVDGWQQGFVVPSGAGGAVHLAFEPDTAYRRALLLGAVVALLLVLGAAATAVVDLRGRGRLLERGSGHATASTPAHGQGRGVRHPTLVYAVFVVACLLFGGLAAAVGALAWAWPVVRSRAGVVACVGLLVGASIQLGWVLTGGAAMTPPMVVDLAVGVAVTVLVARSFSVPGAWSRAGGTSG
jgi:arabinofuranan 3-O-arabinosyltransferase